MGSAALIVILLAALCWLCGWILLSRVSRARCLPPGEAAPPAGVKAAAVSIIIPARNEAHNLPRLLESIQRQADQPLELIVVDDGSTDDTAKVAARSGARVLASEPLPDGWRGKPWACLQGAREAKGDFLMFLDADVRFDDGGFARMRGAWNGGALSLCPFHEVEEPYEQLSAFFNFLMVAGTVPNGLFGQSLLVDRESYERVGGHEAVKGHVLENFRLARCFREADVPVRGLNGRGVVSFRMYPDGYQSLVEGWTKGFASGAGATAKTTMALSIVWLSGLMLPLPVWLLSPEIASLVYLAFAGQLILVFGQVGSFKPGIALLYPVPLIYYFALFSWSASRSGKKVTWKGREIHGD
jgi:4,4'-diaponeurosporenoate glycosyltransferase